MWCPDSRNIPVEFTEARLPFRGRASRPGRRLGRAGRYRGGLGYDKHIRMLRDAHFMSIADRSILSCWGVYGGRAGQPFRRRRSTGREREGLVDDRRYGRVR